LLALTAGGVAVEVVLVFIIIIIVIILPWLCVC